jgi:hypothetical protein
MSREVDRDNPKTQDDLRYLAERDQLSPEWVEAIGGQEGVLAVLNGEKVKVDRKVLKEAQEAAEAEAEEETEDEEEAEAQSSSRSRARSRAS